MSNFISYSDYKSFIRTERLNQLIDNDTSILNDAEGMAISDLQNALDPYYDTASELAKTGTARNTTLKKHAINLTLYYIYQRLPADMIPEQIVKNYDDTRKDLKDLEGGNRNINIAGRISVDSDGDGIPDRRSTKFRWGSKPKRAF